MIVLESYPMPSTLPAGVSAGAILASLPPAPGGRIAVARRVSQAELRAARFLLYQYRTFALQLADLEGDAVHGGYSTALDTQTRSGGVSNPTMHRALLLVQSGEVQALQRRVRAVTWTLAELGDEAKRLVLLRGMPGYVIEELARETRAGHDRLHVDNWGGGAGELTMLISPDAGEWVKSPDQQLVDARRALEVERNERRRLQSELDRCRRALRVLVGGECEE